MDKSIIKHYDEMNKAIEGLTAEHVPTKVKDLYHYHIERVHDFQHERHIHLLVTFFFSGLLLLSIVGLLWVSSIAVGSGTTLAILFGAASVILFVTVLFYVRYYYRLENGVQKLYSLSERLHQLMH
jgi:ABC-type multidrug transport system fused ATPase/permease subunit